MQWSEILVYTQGMRREECTSVARNFLPTNSKITSISVELSSHTTFHTHSGFQSEVVHLNI
jgi:hypothetical protein